MARYRHIDMSPRLLPVDLQAQLVPGSFAHAVHHLVDQLDLTAFDARYRNDEAGAPAHAPAMLLKAVLLAYSQGMVSSRSIERACRDNVLFIALTGDAKPHFTTLADFVSRSREAIATIFAQVLTLLDGEGLIGREGLLAFQTPTTTSHIPVGRVRHRWRQVALERLQTSLRHPRRVPRAGAEGWSVRRPPCWNATRPTTPAQPKTYEMPRPLLASSD
jgi:transposase